MKSTASVPHRVAAHVYTPPDLTVPESPEARHGLYSRAILAAVKLMESRLSSTNPDEALDAAKTLIHLEETRLRHDRAVADAPAPKPPSTTPELPPIRPIRRPDDLVGAEIDCWFGDAKDMDPFGEEDTATLHVVRKLREKLALVEPNSIYTEGQVADILDKLMILKTEEEQRASSATRKSSPRSAAARPNVVS